MRQAWSSFRSFWQQRSLNAWIVFYLLVYCVIVIKLITVDNISTGAVLAFYSSAVSLYILTRFILAYFYEPEDAHFDPAYQPTVSFAVPSKNEGVNIRETIRRIAQSDYPREKFDIIAINDGSTDDTLAEMLRAKKEVEQEFGVRVEVVDWQENRGKREGMAACVQMSAHDIVVFIDSDSFVVRNTVKELVKYFRDPEVGAVAGHAYVANAEKNILTKMQSARYFVAFKAFKAAESLFNSVTCCSGCCAAYRRSDVLPVLDRWLHQRFLGVACTYGDDRALTNMLLDMGKKAMYSPTAMSYTFVPDNFGTFMKQQMRWKKSWVRECFRASLFMWRRHPIASVSFYLGVILPLLAPIIVFRALVWFPITHGVMPWVYVSGLVLMALIYGLYYYIYTRDRSWAYGTVFAVFYTLVLMWQLPWAILNLRDSRWGTR